MKSFALCALLASASAVRVQRGDAWPGVILPGSEPIMPIPSDPIDLQLDEQAAERANVRLELKNELRSALDMNTGRPSEVQFVQIRDADDTVEGAREKAAQMQAQLDKAVADADAKRAQQQAEFEA